MTKKEVMNYVTETPHNVNRNILGQKLDDLQKNVSWNDLKDKPFGESEKEVILAEQRLTNLLQEIGGTYAYQLDGQFTIEEGTTYTICFDGHKYDVMALKRYRKEDGNELDGDSPILGNMGIMFGDQTTPYGDLPFVIASGDGMVMCVVADGEPHTIKVVNEVVHELDKKYIGNGVPIKDITLEVFSQGGVFDFTHVAPGLYYTSEPIGFTYPANTTFHAGLFYVSKNDGRTFVVSLGGLGFFRFDGEIAVSNKCSFGGHAMIEEV